MVQQIKEIGSYHQLKRQPIVKVSLSPEKLCAP